MTLDQILDGIIANEGGYVNNPNDSGQATNFGITQKVAQLNGYSGPMQSLPLSLARAIYQKQYINGPGFAFILPISDKIAFELIDTGVNMGVVVAGQFLQRALNVLTEAKLTVDGSVGNVTRNALRGFLTTRKDDGEAIVLKALNCLQGARYISLVESNDKDRVFVCGWLKNRVSI